MQKTGLPPLRRNEKPFFSIISSVIFVLTLCLLKSCSLPEKKNHIAAASSTTAVLQALLKHYQTKHPKFDPSLSFGASGALAAQITAGAPYRLFISADTIFPEVLHSEGLSSGPIVYTYGKLVFWSTENLSPEEFLLKGNSRIALAETETAPYGRAAKAYLEERKLWNRYKQRFVFGRNISQVNHFIASGAVRAGFTSRSSCKGLPEGVCTELQELGSLPQAAVFIGPPPAELQDFFEFICSAEAQPVWESYGYESALR